MSIIHYPTEKEGAKRMTEAFKREYCTQYTIIIHVQHPIIFEQLIVVKCNDFLQNQTNWAWYSFHMGGTSTILLSL